MVHSSRSMTPESGNFPLRMREKRVVLPAPLGPTSATSLPKFTWNEAFSKSVRPPSVILRSRIVSMKKIFANGLPLLDGEKFLYLRKAALRLRRRSEDNRPCLG